MAVLVDLLSKLDEGVPRGTHGDLLGVTIFFPVPKCDVLPMTRVNIPGQGGDPSS